MFGSLSSKFNEVFDNLTKKGVLSEVDLERSLSEIRLALIEADVSLTIANEFIDHIKVNSLGEEVLKSVTPGQMVVKIVHDQLIKLLGPNDEGINLNNPPPLGILLVGLQGTGKTTTAGKLAYRLSNRENKKVLLVGLDVARPAAQEQLAILAEESNVDSLQSVMGEQPVGIARRGMEVARTGGYDVVVFDSGGRLTIDQQSMTEIKEIKHLVNPAEALLVADALSGQDAVSVAEEFNNKLGLTGIILTRVDGDSRGGAALSMKAITGCPIKLMGVGEKIGDIESFDAERIAGRILGMGDIVGLVEKASEVADKEKAEKAARRALRGQFTLEDLADQLSQLRKMGNMQGLLGMLPGVGKMRKQVEDVGVDDRTIAHQEAIIFSMTPLERQNPKILNGKRRKRIALGSGTSVQEVNRLLKQHKQMAQMMKKMGKGGGVKQNMQNILPGDGITGLPPSFKF